MTEKEAKKLISDPKIDFDRIDGYIRMFDRILLYTMAVNLMPKEALDTVMTQWEQIVKKTIDIDAVNRTNFIEGTKLGRLAKYKKEPDGEEVRLSHLKHWKTAKDIVSSNLLANYKDDDFDDFDSDEIIQ
jgi:hypothetical protein